MVLSSLAVLLSGCAGLVSPVLPTPVPSEVLPTLVVLTSQAAQATAAASLTPSGRPEVEATLATVEPPEDTPTAAPTRTPTAELLVQETATPTFFLPLELSGLAPSPDIRNDPIEIRNLGPLSRVASPLHVYAYLKPGAESRAHIELLGEEGRLLFAETKIFNVPQGAHAILSLDIEFEIAAAAEAGRLQISVEDEHGRLIALNSVPLILLSLGESDIFPPSDLLDPIVIEQPAERALIQGGTLFVSGVARLPANSLLLARLIAEDGREVGSRLATVSAPPEGGYGPFAVEVTYTISEPTMARLMVSQGDKEIMDFVHLSSVEVLLSP